MIVIKYVVLMSIMRLIFTGRKHQLREQNPANLSYLLVSGFDSWSSSYFLFVMINHFLIKHAYSFHGYDIYVCILC